MNVLQKFLSYLCIKTLLHTKKYSLKPLDTENIYIKAALSLKAVRLSTSVDNN